MLINSNTHLTRTFRPLSSSSVGGGEGNCNMTATLYYYPLSPPCRSVLILGKMLGIEFELKSVNPLEKEQLKRDFVEVSKTELSRGNNNHHIQN